MKKIVFKPRFEWSEIGTDAPTPMVKLMPNWYKNLPKYHKDVVPMVPNQPGPTMKMCVPILDSLIMRNQNNF